jgi:ABC-type Na+ transport system ATPase subunit NatA
MSVRQVENPVFETHCTKDHKEERILTSSYHLMQEIKYVSPKVVVSKTGRKKMDEVRK